ncbi:MAG: DUF3887 domain-containing protein [Firmicutes bacterium]|nr:DUF3887 domain-containing protein [Bacillota bacterium]
MMNRFIWIFLLLLVLINSPFAEMNSDIDILAEEFVPFLAAEDFNNAYQKFDQTMKNALPLKKLEETWKSVIYQCGNFKRQASLRRETNRQFRIVIVLTEFEKAVLDIKVVFNADNEISGLFFAPGQMSPGERRTGISLSKHNRERS